MQQQQYKVNNKIFDSIESAGEYMLTLKRSATMEVYTPPSAASVKLNVVRNILIREMLNGQAVLYTAWHQVRNHVGCIV